MSADTGPVDSRSAAFLGKDALHNLCLADPLWVERYEGWSELGRGGSATVIRTHSKAAGEDIALKIFPRLEADDWERFQQEVRNAQRLASPHIVRTYSPFLRGSIGWIEMEFVDGPNLRQELERRAREKRPFSFAEALHIASAVASALVAAHEAGVIHRDVKPANVLLPRAGQPAAKLGDFGTSRLTGGARITKTGLLVGTPQFAAPEVIAGQPAGPGSDVYALTLCLYLVLSNNRFPFQIGEEGSATQWMRAHSETVPLSITTFNRDVPKRLDERIGQGLAKDPEQRPTAGDWLETLVALRSGLSPAAGAAPFRKRGGVSGPMAAVVVAAVIMVGLGVGLWRMSDAAGRAPANAWPSPTARPVVAESATSSGTAIVTPAESVRNTPRSGILPTPQGASARPRGSIGPPAPSASSIHSPANEPSLFRASLSGDLLMVMNLGRERVTDLRITLVGPDGVRFTANAPEGLAAGEQLYLAFDNFTPAPPAGFRPERAELTAVDSAGARRITTVAPR